MELFFSQQESQAFAAARAEWERRHPGSPFPLNAQSEKRLVEEAEGLLLAALSNAPFPGGRDDSSDQLRPSSGYNMQLPKPPVFTGFEPVDFQKLAEDERRRVQLELAAYRSWLNTRGTF